MRLRIWATVMLAFVASGARAQQSSRAVQDGLGTAVVRAGMSASSAMAARGPEEAQPAEKLPGIALMAWGESPSDENQLRGMKEAGLNLSGFCKVADLERVRSAGLQCLVTDPRVNGYDWLQLPADDKIVENLRSLERDIAGNPAALGFFLGDEPNGKEIPQIGHVAMLARQALPGLLPYANLFPTYATPQQLQAESYDAYVKMLLSDSGQPMLSYDNYSLIDGKMLDRFYTNLEIARRISLETHTALWNCILSVAHFTYMVPSDATFNLQVYATLASGGKGIQYFTYFAPKVGNYRLAAIDQFGNRTATWDALRRINLQVQALAPTLAKLHSTGVFHYPDVPEQGHPLSESRIVRSVELSQPGREDPQKGRVLVGELADESGRPYIMIVNKDLSGSFSFQVELREPYKKLIRVSSYTGEEEDFGGEMNWLAPGAGILFRVE